MRRNCRRSSWSRCAKCCCRPNRLRDRTTYVTHSAQRSFVIVAMASAIMLIVTGVRQSTGLFVAPIHEATGMSLVSISLALAIGQFMWGAAQSAFGVLADRY